jgi:hypothetical protein
LCVSSAVSLSSECICVKSAAPTPTMMIDTGSLEASMIAA